MITGSSADRQQEQVPTPSEHGRAGVRKSRLAGGVNNPCCRHSREHRGRGPGHDRWLGLGHGLRGELGGVAGECSGGMSGSTA